MPLLRPDERSDAALLRDLAFSNPFLPARVDLEERLLGSGYVRFEQVKARRADGRTSPNTPHLVERARALRESARLAAEGGREPNEDELACLAILAQLELYHRFLPELFELAERSRDAAGSLRVDWFERFEREARAVRELGSHDLLQGEDPGSLLALFFQFARAFHFVHTTLAGRSEAATELRASIWTSIFTHDVVRYRRALRERMADVSTLVTGPSGTGKELVAAAIARSAFVPFDAGSRGFELEASRQFLPLHLAAFSRDLLESELFGHRRGAFTGALDDHVAALERCAASGTVFLDELGEIDASVQLKLLRVLQTREFQRVGDPEVRRFRGRLVSATNRDLRAEIRAGRFREDLFYRLCSDRIRTPRLQELLAGDTEELVHLLTHIATDLLADAEHPDSGEALDFAAETAGWIERHLGAEYPWPGNFRELEQCARSVLVRGAYRPDVEPADEASPEGLVAAFTAGSWTADRLLRAYCRRVHAAAGSYEAAARRLGLDRRTVKAKVSGSTESGANARGSTP